jgi:hypothetical protein
MDTTSLYSSYSLLGRKILFLRHAKHPVVDTAISIGFFFDYNAYGGSYISPPRCLACIDICDDQTMRTWILDKLIYRKVK